VFAKAKASPCVLTEEEIRSVLTLKAERL
jgi:hypothetical protein